jgi:DNA mismatch repair protein MutS2
VLVLLDELAGATDPEAGATLACAIVKKLVGEGAAVAVTTHYQALKALAAERDDMHNAAVGFDFDEMAPTFRMKMGVPGSSNALEVARRYGIPNDVVEDARTLLPEHSQSFETLVAKLEDATEAAHRERAALEAERATLERDRQKLVARREALKAREAKGLGVEAQRLVDRVREVQRELDRAKKALREKPESGAMSDAGDALVEGGQLLGDIDSHRLEIEPKPVETTALDADDVRVGDRVWVDRLRSVVEVIEGPARGKVRVAAGMMKLWVDVSDLRALKDAPAKARRPAKVSGEVPKAKRSVRTSDNTLDIRGLRADEAVALAEAFLDRMYGNAEPAAYIVHGIGSGALRDALHSHLSQDETYVEGFRPADQDEGGPQVTVVTLR